MVSKRLTRTKVGPVSLKERGSRRSGSHPRQVGVVVIADEPASFAVVRPFGERCVAGLARKGERFPDREVPQRDEAGSDDPAVGDHYCTFTRVVEGHPFQVLPGSGEELCPAFPAGYSPLERVGQTTATRVPLLEVTP
jgi:hypothetical protein